MLSSRPSKINPVTVTHSTGSPVFLADRVEAAVTGGVLASRGERRSNGEALFSVLRVVMDVSHQARCPNRRRFSAIMCVIERGQMDVRVAGTIGKRTPPGALSHSDAMATGLMVVMTTENITISCRWVSISFPSLGERRRAEPWGISEKKILGNPGKKKKGEKEKE